MKPLITDAFKNVLIHQSLWKYTENIIWLGQCTYHNIVLACSPDICGRTWTLECLEVELQHIGKSKISNVQQIQIMIRINMSLAMIWKRC